jgi:hypothetical protein
MTTDAGACAPPGRTESVHDIATNDAAHQSGLSFLAIKGETIDFTS